MAFSLSLPDLWVKQGWKAKIRDRERLEPPHVTVLRGPKAWRLNLRDGAFLDDEPDPTEVPKGLRREIKAALPLLRERWNEMYPENPVDSIEDDDD